MKNAWRVLFLCLVPLVCHGQSKRLTITGVVDQLGLETRPDTPLWMPDGDAYLRWEEPKGWLRYGVGGGKAKLHLAQSAMVDAFAALPEMDRPRAEQVLQLSQGTWNARRDALLFNVYNDLFLFQLSDMKAVRLTHDAADEVGVDFSPDGRMVSFIRDFNIHLISLDTFAIRQLTADGSRSLLYGRLDWVYQEELYGRGNFRGYWWSPDSTRLAFLRIDERDVPDYTVVDHIPYHPELEVTHYPKAGDPNPKVGLGVVPASGGEITWMDTFAYEGAAFLIVRVAWHPGSAALFAQIQNREQTWLDLVAFHPGNGQRQAILKERSQTWVEVLGQPVWSPDGKRFVWNSERDGYNHLYLYEANGTLVKQLTSGPWEASFAHGFSADGRWFYFEENKDAILDRHLSRVDLEKGAVARLTSEPGTHGIDMAPGAGHYFDIYSSMAHPTRIKLCSGKGKPLATIAEGDAAVLEDYALGAYEFLQVPTRDGFTMEAMLIKPPGFDPNRTYPVMSYTYSGPHAPSVRNRWGGIRYLWHQMLAADLNCLIWICDNRTASGKGKVSVDPLYRNFGESELRDLEDGIAWLKQKPFVDGGRIGIWGWSYGGYMTLYALTHSQTFKLGIAGAPVTDWRDYDTIYTERYMAMPQNNPEGYIASSPVYDAADLHGRLLLIHGTIDDNVHLQNSMQMIYALQKAGKQFDFMAYPKSRHGVRGKQQRMHLYTMMTDFVKRHL